MKKIAVDQELSNLRLDKFLCKKLDISFGLAQKLIRQKKVHVNNRSAEFSYKVAAGDVLEIDSTLKDRYQKSPKLISSSEKKKFFDSIIYQDDSIIVINKPSGIAVQGGSKIKTSIDDIVKEQKWQLVHRLDRDTSGLLLIAKNSTSAEHLINKFKDKQIKKTYLALVLGIVKKDSGTIDIALIKKHDGKIEKVFADQKNGKKAITDFKVIKRFSDFSLLELQPVTGRTHQIRVHLKEIGYPIINDVKYGGMKVKRRDIADSLCLHSFKIGFRNQNNKNIALKTDFPNFVKVVLN